jgi:Ca2+-binding RTX toxin-like protein
MPASNDSGSALASQEVTVAGLSHGGVGKEDGESGGDVMTGNSADNTLSRLGGNDTLNGGDGNDRLSGGLLADTLNGDAGNDTLFGGSENDILIGGAGDDFENGAAGNDTFSFAGGGVGSIRFRDSLPAPVPTTSSSSTRRCLRILPMSSIAPYRAAPIR